MATEVVKTIKQSGGDYSSLTAWETGEHRDLVTADQIAVAEFWGSTWTLTDANSFASGWTVDSTRYIELRVHPGDSHTGTRGTGFALTFSSLSIIRPVSAANPVHVKRLRLVAAGNVACLFNNNGGGFFCDGVFADGVTTTAKVVGPAAGSTFQNGFIVGGASDGWYDVTGANLYYSVVYGSGARGVVNGVGSSVVRNVISIHNTGVCFFAATGVTYCISGDTTGGTGTGVIKSATATANASPGAGTWVIFTNLTSGSENFNLQNSASNAALSAGTPISGITTDYAGDTRDATTPDIGADELITSTAYSIIIGTGTFTLSGQAVAITAARPLIAGAATYSVSGQNVVLRASRPVVADTGSFLLAGQNVALRSTLSLIAANATFSLSGQDVALTSVRELLADFGSFSLSGQDVALRYGTPATAGVGSFVLAGQDAGFVYVGSTAAGTGIFTLAGQDVSLSGFSTYSIPAATGIFSLSGENVGLAVLRRLAAGAGAFAIAGQAVRLTLHRVLAVGTGAVALAGQDVGLTRQYPMPVDAGAFSVGGQDAGFLLVALLPVGEGVFVLAGQDVTFAGGIHLHPRILIITPAIDRMMTAPAISRGMVSPSIARSLVV